MNARTVCILGMHRSGTSAVTRAVNMLGVDLGNPSSLLPANPENPEGFWEHQRIIDINDRILKMFGHTWYTREPLPEAWVFDERLNGIRQEMKQFLLSEFSGKSIWGWKDPRTCLLFPLWLEVINELNTNIEVLFVIRNPAEVVNSLVRRNSFDAVESYTMWALSHICALKDTVNVRKYFIHYDRFLQNPLETMERVAAFFNLTMADKDGYAMQLQQFVKPSLRHSTLNDQEFFGNSNVPQFVKDLYRLLLKAEQSSDYTNSSEFAEQLQQMQTTYYEFTRMMRHMDATDFLGQVFIDCKNGYTEEKSKIFYGKACPDFLEYTLDLEQVSGPLRFDPVNIVGVLTIDWIKLCDKVTGAVIYEWSPEDIRTGENIYRVTNTLFCTTSTDPQLFLDGHPDLERGKLSVRMKVIPIPEEMVTLNRNVLELTRELGKSNKLSLQLQKQALDRLIIISEDNNKLKEELTKARHESELLQGKMEAMKTSFDEELAHAQDKISILEKRIGELDKELNHLIHYADELKGEIRSREQSVQELQTQLVAFKEVTNELQIIKNSHGFKLLQKYYKLRERILPISSRRRKYVKILFLCVTKFRNIRTLVNRSNVKKVLYYLKKGNVSAVLSRVESKLSSSEYIAATADINRNRNAYFGEVLKGTHQHHTDGKPATVVDIIVPIYNAYEYTKKCLEKVYENSDVPYNLYLINDCSPDFRIAELLTELENVEKPKNLRNLVVVHNEENLGFVKNVNKGISLSRNHVILLNTDTEVPKNWISRMLHPILTNPRVASVTPFSNSATTCSFPNFCEDNDLPEGMSVDTLDALFRRYGTNHAVELPSGVGFCMAMNRQVIERIGALDAETFGKGYGEENDWCLRAHAHGFINVLAPNLFVYHKHGVSFKQHTDKKREDRIAENLRKVEERYPHYTPWVHRFIAEDPIKPIRDTVISAVRAVQFQKEGYLFVNHTLGGGSKSYQERLIETIREEKRIYTLDLVGEEITITDYNQNDPFRYVINLSDLNRQSFDNLMSLLNIDLIYINQLVTYPVEKMIDLITSSGRKYLFFVHDYYAACPSYCLMNKNDAYCFAETRTAICNDCIKTNLVTEPWIQMKAKDIDIVKWREMFGDFLSKAAAVVAPSEATREIIAKYYPDVHIQVKEHELHSKVKYTYDMKFALDSELKIGFVGALGENKGSNLIYELHEEVVRRNLPIKIKVIGVTNRHQEAFVSADGKFELTGRYDPNQVSELLEKHRIAVVVIPALWPETYSYTTSEALASGYPVFTFDLGAPAERVKRFDSGWVASPIGLNSLIEQLEELLSNRDQIVSKAKNLRGLVTNGI